MMNPTTGMTLKFLITVGALMLIGCETTINLKKLPENRHPRLFVFNNFNRKYEPIEPTQTKIEDKAYTISYTPDSIDSGVAFRFQNKSNEPIKIIWDECAFIDADGKSEKIFHGGVKIADKSSSLPPTMIPPQAEHQDTIIPSSRVTWSRGWNYEPICGFVDYTAEEIADLLCVGKTMGFMITLEVKGKKIHKTLKYKLASREPKSNTIPVPLSK
jgi:hypothetical protein